jgi:hypothetical protein
MTENTTTTKGVATPETLARARDAYQFGCLERAELADLACHVLRIEDFAALLRQAGYPPHRAKSYAERWIWGAEEEEEGI